MRLHLLGVRGSTPTPGAAFARYGDAQYLAEELPTRGALGHSAAEYAVALGEAAGAGCVVLFHHDPARTDDEVDAIVARFADASLPVHAAVEGAVLAL